MRKDENGDNVDDELTCVRKGKSEGEWTSRGSRNDLGS